MSATWFRKPFGIFLAKRAQVAAIVGRQLGSMGEGKEQGSSAMSALGGLVMLAVGGWYFFGGGQEQHVEHISEGINAQVAADAAAQYAIAKRSGSPMDACVSAGLLSAAYLQANDEPRYKAAKAQESADCATAGMPH